MVKYSCMLHQHHSCQMPYTKGYSCSYNTTGTTSLH